MHALDDCLDCAGGGGISGSTALAGANSGAGRADGGCQIPAGGNGGLRKGLSRADVETRMGKRERVTDRSEGNLKGVPPVCARQSRRPEADIVDGVLGSQRRVPP